MYESIFYLGKKIIIKNKEVRENRSLDLLEGEKNMIIFFFEELTELGKGMETLKRIKK